MGEAELYRFIILGSIILFIFILWTIIFTIQNQHRRLIYEKEKAEQNERHLRELLFTKIEIQQQTMNNIGREIHDNVGQQLTLGAMYSYQLEYLNRNDENNQLVLEISKIFNQSLADLRSLSKSLTNVEAENRQLQELIETECERVNALNICKVSYEHNLVGEMQISANVKSFIHRITQEFLQNSIKHSGCKHIKIRFNNTAEALKILMEDDGKGFDMKAYLQNNKKGIGLVNIKTRAEILGAKLIINSLPASGTHLDLIIPSNKLNTMEYEL